MQASLPPFSCTHTPEFPELLAELDCTLVLSTYQAGKLIFVSSDGEKLRQLPRTFDTPMGVATRGNQMAVGTKHEVLLLANDPRLADGYPNKPKFYDALYVPRSSHYCGHLDIHDLIWADEGLMGVSTLFSCLFRLDESYSFQPVWRPPFISELAPEDRCHLNGLCLVDGHPRYVTAFSETDSTQSWRPTKLDSGVLMDVTTNEVILRDLPMPHSPRVFDGELYLLLSVTGDVVKVDVASGKYEVINRVPAFVRGMVKWGDYLFVGGSHLRKSHTFGDLPLAQEGATFCGVMVIHLPTGAIVSQLKYVNSCEEIFDVQVLHGVRRPGILGTRDNIYQRALSLEERTYWAAEEDEEAQLAAQMSQRSEDLR